ncbi:MAG: hypothetical protein ACLS63_01230 [Flavonifractor plautii]
MEIGGASGCPHPARSGLAGEGTTTRPPGRLRRPWMGEPRVLRVPQPPVVGFPRRFLPGWGPGRGGGALFCDLAPPPPRSWPGRWHDRCVLLLRGQAAGRAGRGFAGEAEPLGRPTPSLRALRPATGLGRPEAPCWTGGTGGGRVRHALTRRRAAAAGEPAEASPLHPARWRPKVGRRGGELPLGGGPGPAGAGAHSAPGGCPPGPPPGSPAGRAPCRRRGQNAAALAAWREERA